MHISRNIPTLDLLTTPLVSRDQLAAQARGNETQTCVDDALNELL